MRQFDSPSEFLDVEEIDRDDGVRIVIEKQAVRSMEQADIHEIVDTEDVYLDDAGEGVDEEYDEDGNPIVRKPKKKKRKVVAWSLTTADKLASYE